MADFMTLPDYVECVSKDASDFLDEHFDEYGSFEDLFDAMMGSRDVTGAPYGYCDFMEAAKNVALLCWDYAFIHDNYPAVMGKELGRHGSPVFFDMDVRRYCLNVLKSKIRNKYEFMQFEEEFK